MRDVDPSDSAPAYRLIFADLDGKRYTAESVRSWLMFLWARRSSADPWVWVACGRDDEMRDLQSRLKCSASVIVPWDVCDPAQRSEPEFTWSLPAAMHGRYRWSRGGPKCDPPNKPSEAEQAERIAGELRVP